MSVKQKRTGLIGNMLVLIAVISLTQASEGYKRLEDLPGYDRYKQVMDEMGSLVTGGTIQDIVWSGDGSTLSFTHDGKRVKYDLEHQRVIEEEGTTKEDANRPHKPEGRPKPGRGQQRAEAPSPDGEWIAKCKNYNVVLEKADDSKSIDVTTLGSRKLRYGKANWVYGEELDQLDAMWWSPDSTKLAYYEFDESHVPDFYLVSDWTDVHTKVLTEGYSKAGDPNPRAGLFIYNVLNKDTVHIDVGNDPDQYIYGIDFTKDGTELLFHRMNRRQNVVEVLAASVKTGQSRVVVKEEQKTWQRQAPEMKFLQDGYRFIWETEKNGWKNYELRDLGGKLITTLTNDEFPVNKIEMIREESSLPGGGTLYYTAFSDVNKLNSQLHIVNLDGSGHTVLTKLPLNHRVNVSPNGKWFVSEYQSIEMPPTTGLFDNTGNEVAELAESDTTKMKKMGLAWPESVICASPDGETELYGVLYKPSNFDPHKKYPLVISVYGGPESQSVENVFKPAQPGCELGFLIAQFDNRGTVNRGKKFEEALYLNLGSVELDDQAAGVKFLAQREYVDATRVGIFGFSYGGYMSALALLKQPDVFQVAVAGGTVTDWKNYDSIYTERYMQTPQANPKGYEESSCLTHIDALKGHLLLLHGMVDDNVHPTNLWQFVDLLQKAGKPFDMMLFANSGHGFRMMEAEYRWPYLYEHLIGDHAEESKPSLAAGADTKKERESVPQ